MLLNRLTERVQIDHVLASAKDGMSAVLVLRGDAGTGKTALLDYAVDSAGDLDVVRLVGIESEAELGFAALHQLLVPYLGRLDSLPAPQRQALSTVFGIRGGGPPDRFLVGLASLTLLSAAATVRPLLCVVDDMQWLDQESAAVLAFIARRLHADAIGMLFAVREPSERRISLAGLPSLHVPGLPPAEARQLLAHASGDKASNEVIEQIITQTSGNPLALIELGRDLAPEQLSGEAFLPVPLPVGRGLQARFLSQVRRLPAATQVLLLTAAADPTGDPALLWRAGKHLGFDARAAGPAEAAELVTIGTALAFRHPLVRSAIYHGAPVIDRQRVHQALAEATDPASGVDLSAWHRSEAATGPDEAVAMGLEQAAERARRRGGWSATAAYLTRSAAFTPDAAERLRRVLAAAQAENIAGAAVRAQVLLDSVAGELRDPHQRIAGQRIQGAIHYALMQPAKTASILLDAARQIAPVDVGQARNALLDALAASMWSGRLAAPGATGVDIARAVRSLPQSPSPGSIDDLLLEADAALILDGRRAAAPALSRAVAALRQTLIESADLLTWAGIGCCAASALNDDGALYSLATRLENQARDQGAVPTLSVALILTGASELFGGDLARARVLFTEREAIEGTRGEDCGVGEAMVLAWQGQVSDARTRVAAAARSAAERGVGWKLVYLEYALAVLELGQGHYEEALAAAPHGYEESVILSCFALPDLIEAAARCGELAFARDALDRVEERAAASPTPLALGLRARSRALLAAGPAAEALYQEAITHLGQARGVSHLARAHLLYGEWLRREKRRRDAREHLRTAWGMFDTMGAGGFAERARLELAATGETARKRDPGQHDALTPQELQIAVLAAAGATNPEIAAKLFLSPKTVDYHLGKIFRKLGVSSRRQLAGVPLGHP